MPANPGKHHPNSLRQLCPFALQVVVDGKGRMV